MHAFTRPQMKPLHHVHSLSICCVPATLLCSRFFFPRILQVNSERQRLTCSTHEETYQLMYHEKFTAYQHICHFLNMNHKQTYQLYHEKSTSISTRMSLHVHEPEDTYQLMYMNHTQRINTYVTPMKMNHQDRTIKNVITPPPRTPPTNTQHINTYVTSMKMNHQDRTIKNVITPSTQPPPEPPPTNIQRINTYVTSMKMNHQDRTIKNVITPHPRTPPTNTQHINTYVTSMKMNHQDRTIKNVLTPPTPPPRNPPNEHPAYQHLCHMSLQ